VFAGAVPEPPNENKISAGYRERAPIEVEVFTSHLIIFRRVLTIAQRFNAGHYAYLFVESHRDDRALLSSLTGLDLDFIITPSVETLGYCQACPVASANRQGSFPFMRWLLVIGKRDHAAGSRSLSRH
jgi:hypothetical protein